VQARVGSTRLPKKVLLPFYKEQSILEILIDRLTQQFPNFPIIVATSVNPENDELVRSIAHTKAYFYRGSENHVLSRFLNAANYYKLTHCIRICADNPFLDTQLLSYLLDYIEPEKDYISYQLSNRLPVIKSHIGIFGEIVKVSALKRVVQLTNEPLYIEHVTNYLYENESVFNIKWVDIPRKLVPFEKTLRLTVDTSSDFNTAKNIFSLLENSKPALKPLDALIKIVSEHPQLLDAMQKQINQNQK